MKILLGLILFIGFAFAQNGYHYPHKGPEFDPYSKHVLTTNVHSIAPTSPSSTSDISGLSRAVQNSFIAPVPKQIQHLQKIKDPPVPVTTIGSQGPNYASLHSETNIVGSVYKSKNFNSYASPTLQTKTIHGAPHDTLHNTYVSQGTSTSTHLNHGQIKNVAQNTYLSPVQQSSNGFGQGGKYGQNNLFSTQNKNSFSQQQNGFNQQSDTGSSRDSTPIHEENTDVNHKNPYTNSLAKFIPHYRIPERNPNALPAPTYEEQQIHKDNIMNLKFISANLNYNLFNYTTTTFPPPTTQPPSTTSTTPRNPSRTNSLYPFNYQPLSVQGQNFGSSGPLAINLDYRPTPNSNLNPTILPSNKYFYNKSFQQNYHTFSPVKSKELFVKK